MVWLDRIKDWLGSGDGLLLSLVVLLVFFCILRFRRPDLKKMPLRSRMWAYTLIYADQKQGKGKEDGFGKMLYAEKYDLQGKPDYVFRRRLGKAIVPVELKSGRIGDNPLPHQGDFLQLCAYFLLLEEVYGVRPRYGWLQYQDGMFFVRNTRKVRKEVERTMAEMRRMLVDGKGTPNSGFVTCRRCICNGTVCPYSPNGIDVEE